jgi:hypothetical protein
MDHSEAIRIGATEKYLRGELSADDREAYEDHFFGCSECANDVEAADLILRNAKDVLASPAFDRQPVETRRWWSLVWPLPAAAAALVALLSGFLLYQQLVTVPRLRQQLQAATSLQALPMAFLHVGRGDGVLLKVRPRQQHVALRLSLGVGQAYPYYGCEIRDANGRVAVAGVVIPPAEGPAAEELPILLTVSDLAPGAYVVVLNGRQTANGPVIAPDLARYRIVLRYEEE